MIFKTVQDISDIFSAQSGFEVIVSQESVHKFLFEIYRPYYSYTGIGDMFTLDSNDVPGFVRQVRNVKFSEKRVKNLFKALRKNNPVYSDDYFLPAVRQFVKDYYHQIHCAAKSVDKYIASQSA